MSNDRSEPERDEVEQLRREVEELRKQREFFIAEHRWGARLAALIVIGRGLNRSISQWLTRASFKDPFPIEETSNVIAAVIRRVLAIGLLALIPTAILFWQTTLIRDQNRYFREQTDELRKQIAIQEEQGDLVRRKDLLQAIYDGKKAGLSMRVRVEALKALIALDTKLIGQGRLGSSLVNAREIDLSCDKAKMEECADLSGTQLTRVDFTGSDLRGADFRYSNLRDSILTSTDLANADLSGAIIKGTKFRLPLLLSVSVPNDPALLTAVQELENLLESQSFGRLAIRMPDRGFEEWIKKVQLVDFGLSRIIFSPETEASLNKATRAASFNPATTFPTTAGGLLTEDAFLDEGTTLPVGVLKQEAATNFSTHRDHLVKISQVQNEVDRIFGNTNSTFFHIQQSRKRAPFACLLFRSKDEELSQHQD